MKFHVRYIVHLTETEKVASFANEAARALFVEGICQTAYVLESWEERT